MQNENNESQAMEEDPPVEQEKQGAKTNKPSKTKVMKTWEGDTTISQLSATFVTTLQVEQEKLQKAGEDTEETKYKLPTDATEITKCGIPTNAEVIQIICQGTSWMQPFYCNIVCKRVQAKPTTII